MSDYEKDYICKYLVVSYGESGCPDRSWMAKDVDTLKDVINQKVFSHGRRVYVYELKSRWETPDAVEVVDE